MITDKQFNTVYLANTCIPNVYKNKEEIKTVLNNLSKTLVKCGVTVDTLAETKDIWCRDYMPVQVSKDKYVRFIYNPDYLKLKKYERTRTNNEAVCNTLPNEIRDKIIDSEDVLDGGIILDGGNIVRCGDKVVMIDKVFEENPQYTVRQLATTLEELFEAEIIFLHWDTREYCGHADGLLRYIGNDRVLLTAYGARALDRKFVKRFKSILNKHFAAVEELQLSEEYDDNWAYINWLQVKDILILPTLNRKTDEEAQKQILELMPEYAGKVKCIQANALVAQGGCFNCSTWTIKV